MPPLSHIKGFQNPWDSPAFLFTTRMNQISAATVPRIEKNAPPPDHTEVPAREAIARIQQQVQGGTP